MNRIFKVIWSKTKHCYIVVSEYAKANTKAVHTGLRTTAAAAAVAAMLLAPVNYNYAWAADPTVTVEVVDSSTTTQTATVYTTDGAYSKTETDNKLADKANAADVYSKTETDNKLADKANATDVYSKTETDAQLADKANAADVYSKMETDAQLADKANAADVYSKTEADNADKQLQTNIDTEKTAREAGDKALDDRITAVKDYVLNETGNNYVSKADAAVQDAGVVKADKKIGENVTALGKGLYDETAARIGADAAQDKVIQQVNENAAAGIKTLTEAYNNEVAARQSADTNLQTNIDNEAAARKAADGKLVDAVNSGLSLSNDNVLQKNTTAIDDQGNVTTSKTVANEMILNKGKDNQITLSENGIKVGLNSGVMDKDGFYAGGDTAAAAKAALNANGSIKGADDKFTVDADGKVTAASGKIGNVEISSTGAVTGVTDLQASGTITGNKLTDGVASLQNGNLTTTGNINAHDIVATGAISGKAITGISLNTQGGTISGGAITGTTINGTTGTFGSLTTTGNASVGGTLTTNGITNTGNATTDTLTVNHNATVGGDLTAGGAIQGKSLSDGTATMQNGNLTGVKNLSAETITTSGYATIGGDLTVNGKLNVDEIDMNKSGTVGDNKVTASTKVAAGEITSHKKATSTKDGSEKESAIDYDENSTSTWAKATDADGNWNKSTLTVEGNDVKSKVVDSEKNSNLSTQTSTQSQSTLTDKDSNTNTATQRATESSSVLQDKEGKTSTFQQRVDEILNQLKSSDTVFSKVDQKVDTISSEVTDGTNTTSSTQTTTDITNTAKQGTITNEAQKLVNKASDTISNEAANNITNTSTNGNISNTANNGTISNTAKNIENTASENITNTAKNGSITNDAKNIANIASETLSNSAKNITNTTTDNMTNTIGKNLTTTVGGDMSTEVTGNQSNTVKGTLTETVTGKVTEDYKSDLDTKVGGNETHYVAGNQTNTVSGDRTVNVKGTEKENFNALETNVKTNQKTSVGGNQTTTVTGDSSLKAENITNEAKNKITNKAIDVETDATSSIVQKVTNDAGSNTSTQLSYQTKEEMRQADGKTASYLRGAAEEKSQLIDDDKKTTIDTIAGQTNTNITEGKNVSNSLQKADQIASSVTDGTNTTVVNQDAKSLASSITDGTKANNTNSTVDKSEQLIKASDTHFYAETRTAEKAEEALRSDNTVINIVKDTKTATVSSAVTDGATITGISQNAKDISLSAAGGTITNTAKKLVNTATGDMENKVGGNLTNNVTGNMTSNVTGDSSLSAKNITNTAEEKLSNSAAEIENSASKSITDKVGANVERTMTTKKISESVKDGTKSNSFSKTAEKDINIITNGTKTSTLSQLADSVNTSLKEVGGEGKTTKSLSNLKTVSEDTTKMTDAATGEFSKRSQTVSQIQDQVGETTVTTTEGLTKLTNEGGTHKTEMDFADVLKDLGVRGNAAVDGNTTLGKKDADTTLTVNSKSTFKDTVKMERTLEVDGTSNFNDKVTVTKGGLNVTGGTTTDTLHVTSTSTFDGTATFKDIVTMEKDLSVGGNATVAGDVTANSYKVRDKTYINANGQKITNVAAGTEDSDAANYGQLRKVETRVDGVENRVTNVENRVDKMDSRIDKVGANAAAMANLHPLEFDEDSKWNVAAAVGNYKGETATAVGAFYRPNEDVMFNLSTTFGNDENMVGGGLSLRLGKGGNREKDKKLKAAIVENNDLRAKVDDLTARMDALLSVINPNMSKEFPDVPENHWAYEAVTRLAGNDIVQGYEDGKFHGERTMTRYEMAELIYNALSRGAKAEKKLVEEFKPELQAMAAQKQAK